LPGSEVEGSGLGLSIVEAIAEHCGAHISLTNRSDRSGLVARVSFDRVEPVEHPPRRAHAPAAAAGA
jgi:nitrogen fixation/metabolism regulation signal transduction histidine kinase